MTTEKAKSDTPIAINVDSVPARAKRSIYPEPFASMMEGRAKHILGDIFGIKKFGVNLTSLAPGASSALLHRHKLQEEFVYILKGRPTLNTDKGEIQLQPGMCAGFTPEGVAHQLVNHTSEEVIYLEVGDRTPGDQVTYPNDDLVANMGNDGNWRFCHKDGTLYE